MFQIPKGALLRTDRTGSSSCGKCLLLRTSEHRKSRRRVSRVSELLMAQGPSVFFLPVGFFFFFFWLLIFTAATFSGLFLFLFVCFWQHYNHVPVLMVKLADDPVVVRSIFFHRALRLRCANHTWNSLHLLHLYNARGIAGLWNPVCYLPVVRWLLVVKRNTL